MINCCINHTIETMNEELDFSDALAPGDPDKAQEAFDKLPPEAVDHLTKSFIHAAGYGPHPGRYNARKADKPNKTL